MRRTIAVLTAMAALGAAGRVSAASLPGTMAADSMVSSDDLNFLSVGVGVEDMDRAITERGAGERLLEGRTAAAWIGCDLSPWCTVFVSLGQSQARMDENAEFGDGGLKWSLGVNASVWQVDFLGVEKVIGRLSFIPMAEHSRYKSGKDSDTIEWSDTLVALPLSYAYFVRDPHYGPVDVHSFVMYLGPAYSGVEGHWTTGSGRTDFLESREIGVIAGLDCFFTPSVSLGLQVQSFGDPVLGGGFRYHF